MGKFVPARSIVALLNPNAIKKIKSMAIENSKLIDKKSYYHNGELNAVAFIEFFPSGKVQVYGKFYKYYD